VTINKLKNNKAPGYDTIPAECLKYGRTQLHKELHKLVLAIWLCQTEGTNKLSSLYTKREIGWNVWIYRRISLLNAS